MKLIVGLGNPDKKYFKTYHNTGFNAVDFFVKQQGLNFSTKKCKAEICKGQDFIVAKPQTYMNLSGDSVLELKKYEALVKMCDGKASKIIIPTDAVHTVTKNVLFSETTGIGDTTPAATPIAKPEEKDPCCDDEDYKESTWDKIDV